MIMVSVIPQGAALLTPNSFEVVIAQNAILLPLVVFLADSPSVKTLQRSKLVLF